MTGFRKSFRVAKVDQAGRVLGWGFHTRRNGARYVDLQADAFDDGAALYEAVEGFMSKDAADRPLREMHRGRIGTILSVYPLDRDGADALGIDTGGQEGVLILAKIEDADALRKYREGKLPAFSVGGRATPEDLTDAA